MLPWCWYSRVEKSICDRFVDIITSYCCQYVSPKEKKIWISCDTPFSFDFAATFTTLGFSKKYFFEFSTTYTTPWPCQKRKRKFHFSTTLTGVLFYIITLFTFNFIEKQQQLVLRPLRRDYEKKKEKKTSLNLLRSLCFDHDQKI